MRSVCVVCATFFFPSAFGPFAAFPSAMHLRRCALACLATLVILASQASAVVILNTDGTANNSGQVWAPGNGVPYANIGVKGTGYDSGSGSLVYLGNQWAITDNHVNVAVGGSVSINGNTLTVDKTQEVYNSVANGSSPTDLELIHLTSNPGISGVSIAPAALAPVHGMSGQGVTMIGNGHDLGTLQPDTISGQQYYTVIPGSYPPRWGTNVVDPYSLPTPPSPVDLYSMDGNNNKEYAYTFTTTFSISGVSATNQEATATLGDSGGGVFKEVGNVWYLVGLIDGNTPATGDESIVNNNETTVIIDLAYYQTTIAAVVPEPSSFVLGGLGAGIALLAGLRNRRKRQAQASRILAGQVS